MRQWYYIVDHTKTGPVSEEVLREKMRSGELDQQTWVWTEGMPGWTLAAHMDDPGQGPVVEWPEMDPAGCLTDPTADVREPWFLHIGIARLLIMTFLSMGIFQIYWMYHNWRYLRDRDREPMMPFWRAYFTLFWIHALLGRIRNDRQLASVCPPTFHAGTLATLWLVLPFAAKIAEVLHMPYGSQAVEVAVLGSWMCLVPAQLAINRSNRARVPRPAVSRWSLGQVVCVAMGVGFFVMEVVVEVLKAGEGVGK